MNVTEVNNKHNVFHNFNKTAQTGSIYKSVWARRSHAVEKSDTMTKVGAAAGSIVGTIIPMLFFAKKQQGSIKKFVDFFKLRYGVTEMLGISTGSILGGVVGGIISDGKSEKKRKINEGVFQFANATIPTLLVGGMLELIKMSEKYKESKPAKVIATVAGLAVGMPIACKVANLINDPNDKEPDRKITVKDSFVNLDDALGALVIAKFKFVETLHLDKALPAILAWCGYRAGESN